MIKDIVIFTYCSACNEGLHKKHYREFEKNSEGLEVLVDKIGVNYVSFELEPDQLENQTIAEFVESKACRKCRTKALKELVK